MEIEKIDCGGEVIEPKVLEEESSKARTPKQQLLEVLDSLEFHVENLRKEAARLEEEKDAILSSLDTVLHADISDELNEGEQEDIQRYVERVLSRIQTVDIHIHTNRDETQEDALHQVNLLIDSLVIGLKGDPMGTREKCVSFMNACSSHFVQGATDKHFESALLGCTVDDQKRIKKRLQGLLSYFDKLQFIA